MCIPSYNLFIFNDLLLKGEKRFQKRKRKRQIKPNMTSQRRLPRRNQEIPLASNLKVMHRLKLDKETALPMHKRETLLDNNQIMRMLKLVNPLNHKVQPLRQEEVHMYKPSPPGVSKPDMQWRPLQHHHSSKHTRMRSPTPNQVSQARLTLRTIPRPTANPNQLRMYR